MTLVNLVLVASIVLAMMYTGLLFDPEWASLRFLRGKLRPFAGLALVNYLAVPLLTFGMTTLLSVNETLSLTLLTLSVLPCAPMVPALVTLAGEAPEWPLFVFLGFSVTSIAVVVALIAVLTHSTTYAVNIGADTVEKLLEYLLTVYGPMAFGALLRLRAPTLASRLIDPVRALTGIGFIIMAVLFATVHRHLFDNFSSDDLLTILGFVLGCCLLGLVSGVRMTGPRLTGVMATSFRNIALAIAFATVVLRRPDVTAYLVVYSGVTLLVCVVLLLAHRSAARRTAQAASD